MLLLERRAPLQVCGKGEGRAATLEMDGKVCPPQWFQNKRTKRRQRGWLTHLLGWAEWSSSALPLARESSPQLMIVPELRANKEGDLEPFPRSIAVEPLRHLLGPLSAGGGAAVLLRHDAAAAAGRKNRRSMASAAAVAPTEGRPRSAAAATE